MKLECVPNFKVLGLLIDNNLTWKTHADEICTKVAQLVGMLWRIRSYLSTEMKLLFYNSIVLSKIDYCLHIWGSAPSYCIDRIYKLQKQVARIVLNVERDTSSHYMFNKLKWLTIYQCIIYQRYLAMYPIFNNSVPKSIGAMFPRKQEKSHNLRSNKFCSLELHLSRANSTLYEKSFLHSGARLWHALPDSIKCAQSIETSKHMCKMYILGNS